ncbi:hypothetical protein M433DRAFT_532361 [Acidomyces richmondensis BFW]|nr:MAG: hypothetical protein FE78DRAFT_337715 [Acidomyces sp. 'richmondensis']KYG46864.1 hypothetical protein M433DRAFT_532361 [Acidomyces richmondensis BFW]
MFLISRLSRPRACGFAPVVSLNSLHCLTCELVEPVGATLSFTVSSALRWVNLSNFCRYRAALLDPYQAVFAFDQNSRLKPLPMPL